MKREYVDFTIKQLKCISGGSKEACIKVREYLQNATIDENRIIPNEYGCISSQEFMESVRILLAYAWQNREQDIIPERWQCDSSCSNLDTCFYCQGEFQTATENESEKSLSKKICPYFRDYQNI